MADNSQKTREQAELAFSKAQTQSLARNRIVDEHDAIGNEREAKTARLRELRLQKEAEDLARAAANPVAPKRKAGGSKA
ncbi:hypothetical protein G6N74_08515 [Mesorhizobium sp. CGMCC 1.15528]|jgi:hypothetical protein|uniref:Uncharacterized protein n=1 Tax=Mesorhizobium zhangyense TaxID=1776730 RepID=A0A7C9V5A6_9HYPH|nr:MULTISPECIES: hypothetical protein [Mesorhizobium]NGN41105.1 hypothetical protein [Mesorhizobium zhangyense]RJG44473.1 hypothetical protein D3Y55_09505 [Mesorhizobium sp. DCY119]SFT84060.1 hypothetical protein SAMN05518861_10670 [Mesorhizobium sp. YR577]